MSTRHHKALSKKGRSSRGMKADEDEASSSMEASSTYSDTRERKIHQYATGSSRMTTFDHDESDFGGPWNPESIPLLQRTVDQAKSLGVKRTLSWVVGASIVDLPSEEDIAEKKPWHCLRKFKIFVLTLICILITVLLLFLPEETANYNLITVAEDVNFSIDIDQLFNQSRQNPKDTILKVRLKGSFITPEITALAPHKLKVSTILSSNTTETLDTWQIGLLPNELTGRFYLEKTEVENSFNIDGIDLSKENLTLFFDTNSELPVAISVEIQLLSERIDEGVIYGSIVVVALYACIILELAHRTVVAMLAASFSIGILATLNERPSLENIITWVDVETLTLLFSMMVIVSILSETGVFNYIGYVAFKKTKGKVWPLIAYLCLITAVVSAFLDNVTTILLMTPVVIQLCEAINVDPVPVLIATVTFSNIGGAATAIGDPPNVLIASDIGLIEGGITFLNFTLHMFVCVIIVGLVSGAYLRFALRKIDESKEDRELHELRHEIVIWSKTLRGLSNFSKEEAIVKEIIAMKIEELREEYDTRLSEKKQYFSFDVNPPSWQAMEESCRITNKGLLVKASCVLAVTVLLFFLQNIPSLNLSLGWTSLLGALTLLILADKADIESIFARVEWATLVFFAALFVLMEALSELGLLKAIGNLVESIILDVPKDYRLTVAILLILWVSGIASAFIDNIPFTTMMIPVIKGISENVTLDLPLQPLVWSLALGACLGGNGTIIGASANVVCAGVAEQHGYKFTFMDFFKIGFPLTILSLIVSSAYLLICHVAFDWNE